MMNKKTLKPVFAAWKGKKIEYKKVFLGDLNNETKKNG